MTIFCTYCSANKSLVKHDIPAIDRYVSKRIKSMSDSARQLYIKFMILSGKFGLIEEADPIPYYDVLLDPTRVETHSLIVSTQLRSAGVSKVVFMTSTHEVDHQVKPYVDCMRMACEHNEVDFELVQFQSEELKQ